MNSGEQRPAFRGLPERHLRQEPECPSRPVAQSDDLMKALLILPSDMGQLGLQTASLADDPNHLQA